MKEYYVNDGYLYLNDPLFAYFEKIRVVKNNTVLGEVNIVNRKIKVGKDNSNLDIYGYVNKMYLYIDTIKISETKISISENKIISLLNKRNKMIEGVLKNED